MAAPYETNSGDLARHLAREAVLTARAERRLVEFELTRRRVLLGLTVFCVFTALLSTALGHPAVAGGAAGFGLLSGVAGAIQSRRTDAKVGGGLRAS